MEKEIVTLIIAISILILILSLVVVIVLINYKTRQQIYLREKEAMQKEFINQLMQAQLETQEDAFAQLGQELHDNIGQLLSTTKMLLGITERNLSEVPDTLKTAEETLGKAIQDIRALSKSLNREWLQQFNLLENLNNELERINTVGEVQTKMNTTLIGLPLPAESQVMLFRIVQEALQNCIKHAKAKNIQVTLITKNDDLELFIKDDGTGFNGEKNSGKGVGIINMQHRAKLLGGSISWQAVEGNGTEVYIRIPLKQKTGSYED